MEKEDDGGMAGTTSDLTAEESAKREQWIRCVHIHTYVCMYTYKAEKINEGDDNYYTMEWEHNNYNISSIDGSLYLWNLFIGYYKQGVFKCRNNVKQ